MFYGAMTAYGGCYNELERVVNMTVKVILPSLPKNNNFMICIAELITEYSVLFDVLATMQVPASAKFTCFAG